MLNFLLIKSFRKRKFVSLLTIFSISLSLSLFLLVEKMRDGVEESFTNSISNADLIVGARSGPLQLLLYTVFHMGSPTNNITVDSYNKIKSHPAVKWTIPISLGDSYKGFRVVATDENFYKHYQFHGDRKIELKQGVQSTGVFDVVLGNRVAKKMNHQVGDSIILSHGITTKSIVDHENTPFKVVGVMKATGTPIDKSVFISLYGMEALHVGWRGGLPSNTNIDKSSYEKENLKTTQITSFILRSKNRIALLGLQRMIGTNKGEALTAIIPALTLSELWGMLDKLEQTLLGVSFFVILVGFLSLLIVLYMSINERKNEIMILRSIGVSAKDIFLILISETFILTSAGAALGFVGHYAVILLLGPIIENVFGIYIQVSGPKLLDLITISAFILFGGLFGLVPAVRAYRKSLNCQLGTN
jgi:putative ABC transport system permease protein